MKSTQNGSGRRERRYVSPSQKATIVKAHLVDDAPISELCDKHQIQPRAGGSLSETPPTGAYTIANSRKSPTVFY
jgi:hypothetical protein